MFKEVKRKKSAWNDQEQMEHLLQSTQYGYLSVGTTDNGYAYGVPISYAYDKKTNRLYFHGATEGQKIEMLEQDKKLTFCVVGATKVLPERFTTAYESVIVFGSVDLLYAEEDKREAMLAIINKYLPEHKAIGENMLDKSLDKIAAYAIKIEHLTGKAIRE